MRKSYDLKTLETMLEYALQQAINEVAEESKNELVKFISKNWYQSYKPKNYKRTGDFINSVSTTRAKINKNTGEISCEIFYDTKKIRAEYLGYGMLNPHMTPDGQDISEDIPELIEYGPVYGAKKTKRDPLKGMETLAMELEQTFPEKVADKLSKILNIDRFNIKIK